MVDFLETPTTDHVRSQNKGDLFLPYIDIRGEREKRLAVVASESALIGDLSGLLN
jgi:hypothetical protein